MLPLNFHNTFLPERRLISALLDYAAMGGEGNYQDISEKTGIPMGKSIGKVPAIIDYSIGMGLIENVNKETGRKRPILTAFGKVVQMEDKYLGEEIIQWLAHLNLCRGDIGAKVWNAVFAEGSSIIGSSFTKDDLENYLINRFGRGRSRTGPLVVGYTEDAGFLRANIIEVKENKITRKKAPIKEEFCIGYSAYILTLMEKYFPRDSQVTLEDFNKATMIFDICLWDTSDIERVFSLIETKKYISIDRQLTPWIIEKRAKADETWQSIFDDIP